MRYKFFADPIDNGADAIFGLERPLMQLVDFFKSAAQGYGTEKRILLLHGPVGSSQEHDRPAAEEGAGELLARPTPASASPTPGGCTIAATAATRASSTSTARCTRSRCCSSRARRARTCSTRSTRSCPTAGKIRLYGEVCPFCRKVHGRPDGPVRRRLEEGRWST